MKLTIENYLKHNKVITPVQYVEAGQERKFTMFISCKEYLEKVADIVSYSENPLNDLAEVTVKFKEDCLLVFEGRINQEASDTYPDNIDYLLWEVVEAFEVKRRTNETKI